MVLWEKVEKNSLFILFIFQMKFKDNARDGSDLCVSVFVGVYVCACMDLCVIWYFSP